MWTSGGSAALPSQTSPGSGGGEEPTPPHPGLFPTTMACGRTCWPLLVTCASWHRCHLHGGRCLIWQVGLSWGGHGVGTQGPGGHMASLPQGELVPMRSRGTVVPTCPTVTSSCVPASEPTEQGLHLACIAWGCVHATGAPWGGTLSSDSPHLADPEAECAEGGLAQGQWEGAFLRETGPATQHSRLAFSWVWWPPECWGGGGRSSSPPALPHQSHGTRCPEPSSAPRSPSPLTL